MKKTPLQVYLEPRDRMLLEELARRLELSRAETVRAAIRRWALESVGGAGGADPVLALIGTMEEPDLPRDLSTRHDEYAVLGHARSEPREVSKSRRRAG